MTLVGLEKKIKNFIFMPKYDSSKRKMESARERELRRYLFLML
jgi:hypothetical protein